MVVPVSAAYLSVVLIWSTTPLGIVWSSETVSPTMSVLLRMIIALIIGIGYMRVTGVRLSWHSAARKVYVYSTIGIFGGMMCSYFSARYLSSGLMSLIFGLAPIISGLLAQRLLNERKFTRSRIVAMMISLSGLTIVCADGITLKANIEVGLTLILLAVFFFSLSGVLVKSVKVSMHPMATTVGSLLYSIPCFALTWLLFDGTLPIEQWQARSLWTILYLGVFGSLVGFVAYFYVLQKLDASTVALVTMVTPAMALFLGAKLNGEPISSHLLIGACFILCGLALYHFGDKIKQLAVR